jgi:hypothetical protein
MAKSNTPNLWRKTTCDAELAFGEVFLNGIKCAAVLRNVDPTLSKSHYLAFLNSGKLKGGTVNRCPGVYQIRCGDKPVDDISFVLHADNGDIIIGAPNGRIRMFAQSIDMIASGPDNKTGYINLLSNTSVEIKTPTITATASVEANITGEKKVNIASRDEVKVTGNFNEQGPAVIDIPPPGSQTLKETLEGIVKLVKDIVG